MGTFLRSHTRHVLAVLVVCVGLTAQVVPHTAQANTPSSSGSQLLSVAPEAVAERILVTWDDRFTARDMTVASLAAAGVLTDATRIPITATIDAVTSKNVAGAVDALKSAPGVRAAQADEPVVVSLASLPQAPPATDPGYPSQWALENTGQVIPNTNLQTVAGVDIRARTAWAITQGSPDVVVAVIDTAIDATHPDLAGAVVAERPVVANIDSTSRMHGTTVAAVIAARKDNGFGIAGIAPNVGILSIAAFESMGDGEARSSTAVLVRAFDEAKAFGADVINASWVTTSGSNNTNTDSLETLRVAIQDAGVPVVAAAGNDGAALTTDGPYFPAGWVLPNLVTVAAIQPDGQLASFSNRGASVVDIAAPGAGISTVSIGGQAVLANGTSYAAPYVAGALALARSIAPYATTGELVDAVSWSSRLLPDVAAFTATSGMLDAGALVHGVQRPVCGAISHPSAGFPDVTGQNVHARAVDCVFAVGVTRGLRDGTFNPSGTVTRAQMATFLANIVNRVVTLPPAPDAGFPDVVAGSTHDASINRLTELGIIRGDASGNFNPDRPVTRANLAAFLVRTYEVLSDTSQPPSRRWFADTENNTHVNAIDRARELGLVRGTSATTFAPNDPTRRDQMASLLARMADALVRDGVQLPF